jgi:GT2 family glycosyltransferase
MALAVPPGGGEPLPVPQLARKPPRRGVVATPHLSVVIVNYCQWRNTARLVRQLRRSEAIRGGAAEVVVVDNRSPRHPASRYLRKLRGVSLYRSSRNRGFAAAVNHGATIGRGDWVLLLNPDVTVADGFLDDVIDAARRLTGADARAGVVGFRLRNRDGTRQASSGPFPTLLNTLGGLLRPRARRKCRHRPPDARAEVPWVTGGCLLVRRECLRQLVGLDEGFFLYYEDVDFCRRARAGGWSVWYEPEVAVTHHWPLHTRAVPAPLRLITRHALLTYARKHWPRWQAVALAGVVWVEACFRGAAAARAGQDVAAACYRDLRGLVGDVLRGRDAEARRRVRAAAAFLAPVAAAQDRPAE